MSGTKSAFELLEELLDARLMREERVAELREAHLGVRVAEKCFGRRPGLRPPFTGSAQHHPADSEVGHRLDEPEDRSATADLDVVRMRADR